MTLRNRLLKTLREKEKLLIMSNFSFSHNVFYWIRLLYPHFVYIFDIISLFAAELDNPKIGNSGKGLKLHVPGLIVAKSQSEKAALTHLLFIWINYCFFLLAKNKLSLQDEEKFSYNLEWNRRNQWKEQVNCVCLFYHQWKVTNS